MKNLLLQLKRIGLTILAVLSINLIAKLTIFLDESGGIAFVIMIAAIVFGGSAILGFIFLIIVPPKTLKESMGNFEKDNNSILSVQQPSPYSIENTTQSKPLMPQKNYARPILGISFLLFLGFLAVARQQIYLKPAISSAIGGWLWWPLLIIFFICMTGGARRVIIKDSWGTYKEGYISEGGRASLSAAFGFMLSYVSIYMFLAMVTIWSNGEDFPNQIGWISWIVSIFAFYFFGMAFMFLFKSENWRSHIFLYAIMLGILITSRM